MPIEMYTVAIPLLLCACAGGWTAIPFLVSIKWKPSRTLLLFPALAALVTIGYGAYYWADPSLWLIAWIFALDVYTMIAILIARSVKNRSVAEGGITINTKKLDEITFVFDAVPPSDLIENMTANTVGGLCKERLELPERIASVRKYARYPWRVNPTSGGDQWMLDKPYAALFAGWIKEHLISCH